MDQINISQVTEDDVDVSENNKKNTLIKVKEPTKNLNSSGRCVNIEDQELACKLDGYSIEDVVELKISRFLDQIGTYQLENMHELIMSKVEKPLLIQILRRVGSNQVQASKILGINRNTLRKKIKLYHL